MNDTQDQPGTIGKRDPLFFWFWKIPRLLRYLLFVCAGEVPGLLLAKHCHRIGWYPDVEFLAGQFFRRYDVRFVADMKWFCDAPFLTDMCRWHCDVPFLGDYGFHVIYVLALPFYITLLPALFCAMKNALGELSGPRSPSFLDKKALERLYRLWRNPRVTLLTALPGPVVVAVIGISTVIGHITEVRTDYVWWFDGSVAGPAIIYSAFAVLAVICTPPLFQYAGVVNVIRKSLPKMARVPIWASASPGPLYGLFTTFMLTFSPLLLVPIMVIWTRLSAGFEITEPITFIGLSVVPVGIAGLALLPCLLSGVPGRMKQQRDSLLSNNSERADDYLTDPASQLNGAGPGKIIQRISLLSAQRDFIFRNHRIWPIPSLKAAVGTMAVYLSVASAVLALIRYFPH